MEPDLFPVKYELLDDRKTSTSQDDSTIHFTSESDYSDCSHRRRRAILRDYLVLAVVCFLILPLLLYTTWSEHNRNTSVSANASTNTVKHKPLDCGDSVQSAKRLGCVFDPLTYLWMPPACYDFKTSREFEDWLSDEARVFGPWPFFKDTDGQERLENATALGSYTDGFVRTSQEEHIAHCIFVAKSARHALEDGAGFRLNPIITLAHFEHCASELLKLLVEGPNPIDRKQLTTKFRIGFGSC